MIKQRQALESARLDRDKGSDSPGIVSESTYLVEQ